jgi:hypothetical protein
MTREQLQYGVGAAASAAVIAVYCIPGHSFQMGMALFALAALGVASASDYFNSPPPKV